MDCGIGVVYCSTSATLGSMEPLPGLSVVGEFTTHFDAELAVAMLRDGGLEGMVLSDPAYSVAAHLVTERMFRVVVRAEVAEDARELLGYGVQPNDEVEALEAAYHHRHFADRPKWVRWLTWTALWTVPLPALLAVAFIVYHLLQMLFP